MRGVCLDTTDRKRSPRVDSTIREHNVGRVHEPSTVSLVDVLNSRLWGDRSLWESVQTCLFDSCLRQELRLNTSGVVRVGAYEETYTRIQSTQATDRRQEKGEHTELSAVQVLPRKRVAIFSVGR
jgi:hypothetical protein